MHMCTQIHIQALLFFFFNSRKDADTKGYARCDSSYIKFKVELAERNARSIRDPG